MTDPMQLPLGYYAVIDPDHPDVITCWRRATKPRKPSYQTFGPWRRGVRYGPAARREDIPADPAKRAEFAAACNDWGQRVIAAIVADPEAARRLFASFTTRCCSCGRPVSAAESKLYAYGPECRKGMEVGR